MRRYRSAVVAAVLVVVGVAGCAREGTRAQEPAAAVAPAEATGEATGDVAAVPTSAPPPTAPGRESMGAAPARSASAKPSPKPTVKPTRATAPRAVAKPPTETKVPPPPPKPSSTACKPRYVGTQATRAQAGAALADAAARVYWPTSAPDIRIPPALVKATAWQESGWQSNIVACDGGIGLMQVMPATAEWMNQRFEQSYDIDDYRDNAYLGANYLAWLTKYIGDMYFEQDYRLEAGLCTAELDSCLLNAVIAAYNYGHGAVAREGRPLTVPNPQYVRNVRALMTECVCLDY
ncbi:lytic transglycosylase domain-containing protein [Micromonospora endolithica]|uniref:Lytic transglycosylase domain-containing protein n=1 Tax=Micromonospora endolithica TaxID=230091 RepID=A0A3A9ZR10_9ACTN|nr:lytic transglycosylase domain-containing protein [Micromonospora endolithica]RKN50682.1 lytic transglycosylase domain-containing protein [Micromonospora endolithica]TWJ20584.1 soluble lytic murein transglycosylase-like protein [Micromonospora endolithica]